MVSSMEAALGETRIMPIEPSSTILAVTFMFCCWYPTKLITITSPTIASIVNRPLALVTVTLFVALTSTVAPSSGLPSCSYTIPEMTFRVGTMAGEDDGVASSFLPAIKIVFFLIVNCSSWLLSRRCRKVSSGSCPGLDGNRLSSFHQLGCCCYSITGLFSDDRENFAQ